MQTGARWLRGHLGAAVSLVVCAAAVGAALPTGSAAGSTTGGVAGGVEALSAASTALIGQVALALPLGYAFGAGMVAAVNPCGFALLPAYLGLYLGGGDDPGAHRHPHRRFLQAVRVSVMVSASFVLLFGAVGLILGVVSSAAARYFPWVGLAVGVLLVFTGGRMLGGGTLYSSIGERMADRVGASARQNSYRGYFAYGLAYGSASLGCTLPIFLTVVGTTLTASGFLSAALQFVLYGLGMGFVITVLTVSTAFFKHAAIARARRTVRYVRLAGSALLLVAGAYIIYYWLTLGGLLFRIPLS